MAVGPCNASVGAATTDESLRTSAMSAARPFKKPMPSMEPAIFPEPSGTDSQARPITPAVKSCGFILSQADHTTFQTTQTGLSMTLSIVSEIEARVAAKEAEHAKRQSLHDGQLARANRRANNAEQDAKATIEALEEQIAKLHTAEQETREKTETTIDGLQSDLDDKNRRCAELGVRLIATEEGLTTANARLKEYDGQREATEERDRDAQATIESLRDQIGRKLVELTTKEGELAKNDEHLRLYDKFREQLCKEVAKFSGAVKGGDAILAAMETSRSKFGQIRELLDTPLSKVNVDDIQQHVHGLKEVCSSQTQLLTEVVTFYRQVEDAISILIPQFIFNDPNGGTADAAVLSK
ncbi:hypothetical protein MMC16_004771 [Acarospora aff. strigata]|nr:hypothetical protein [Acarospora aff. strigata]